MRKSGCPPGAVPPLLYRSTVWRLLPALGFIAMKKRLQKIYPGLARPPAGVRRRSSPPARHVDGAPAVLGQSADPDTETVAIDGVPLRFPGSTHMSCCIIPPAMHDSIGREGAQKRFGVVALRRALYPRAAGHVVRGLQLMTDDGEAANRLTHPNTTG
jgi:hypothetical protein